VGRFADLCAEVAVQADATPAGLVLPDEARAGMHQAGWADADIADALEFVHATFVQDELIEAADLLSGHVVEMLGSFDDDARFAAAAQGRGALTLDALRRLVRSATHLAHVLAPLREQAALDLSALERLSRRLAEDGVEAAIASPPRPKRPR
jgi:hypothetical protein